MKNSLYNYLCVALVATCVATGAFAQSFTVKGNIKGIKNGTKVSLRSRENGKQITCSTLSKGSAFELKGTVKSPMLVEIEISDKPQSEYKQGDYPEDRGVKFMLENANYTVSAACMDSVPRNFIMDGTALPQLPNVTINGGEAQRQYQEWFKTTYPQQLAQALANTALRHELYFSGKKKSEVDTATTNRLEAAYDKATEELNKVNADFIAAYPNYAISLQLQQEKTSRPFVYSVAELDAMLKTFAGNYDKARLAEFTKAVNDLKKFPKEAQYRNLPLETPDGTKTQLTDCIVKGKYNFIDFWASWCGPCRAAIPSVKEMYKRMSDKVNIISVSVDRKNADWQKALKEENMPWKQYVVPAEGMNKLTSEYMLQFVPTLMVIDPEGKIQVYVNDPAKAHHYLEEHVK